jgi:CHASE3 domain sensor protein
MAMEAPIKGDEEGQSDAAKAWVARRDAAAKAVAAVQASIEQARERELRYVEQQEGGGRPIVFIIGIVVVFAILALTEWFFIDRVQCDPMITDRGLGSQCRRAR